MIITVEGRACQTRACIERLTAFYATQLGLDRSRFTLTVSRKRGLVRKQRAFGMTSHIGRDIYVVLDAGMGAVKLIGTLAHEMVHVRQIARGTLRLDGDLGRPVWRGHAYDGSYADMPWEVEAFRLQHDLAVAVYDRVVDLKRSRTS